MNIEFDISKLGDNVRRVRLLRDRTQQEVADEADISVAHYSNIERGKVTPGLTVIYRISRALDCTIDELLCEDMLTIRRKFDLVCEGSSDYERRIMVGLYETLKKNSL